MNVTLTVHGDPAGTDEPQVFVCENWLADKPENVMLMGNAPLLVLASVTVCAVLVVVGCTLPNHNHAGFTVNCGVATPTLKTPTLFESDAT